MKQITIFGGSGFIGRHIVRRLAATGVIIRVPTRDPEKALALKPAGDVGQIVPIPCALRHDTAVARAIGDSDAVINLIGILYENGRATFQSVHVELAARIARLARERGARAFLHMSALGADLQSSSQYARSKAAGEQAVHTFFPDAVIFRPSLVFGPEDNFFNRFASLARFSPALPLIGGGRTQFQPIYVGDIAEATLEGLTRPEIRGKTFMLGGPAVYSFRQLMELMLAETGRHRAFFSVPWGLAKLQAALFELLPHPLLTRDQVELLKTDTIIRDPKAKTLRDLGLTPTALEVILPTYMERFRAGGRLQLSRL